MPSDFQWLEDQNTKTFRCLKCGEYLGAIPWGVDGPTAIQNLRMKLGYHCPRCGKELNPTAESHFELWFLLKGLKWRIQHAF